MMLVSIIYYSLSEMVPNAKKKRLSKSKYYEIGHHKNHPVILESLLRKKSITIPSLRIIIGLDKSGFQVNIFSNFSMKTYVVGTH